MLVKIRYKIKNKYKSMTADIVKPSNCHDINSMSCTMSVWDLGKKVLMDRFDDYPKKDDITITSMEVLENE